MSGMLPVTTGREVTTPTSPGGDTKSGEKPSWKVSIAEREKAESAWRKANHKTTSDWYNRDLLSGANNDNIPWGYSHLA